MMASLENTDKGENTKIRLRVVVIGGGLAGVSAAIALARHGHSVVVLEAQEEFSELGAGIQIPPNSSKILQKWGLLPSLQRLATAPSTLNFCSYRDGALLSQTRTIPDMTTLYGSPHVVLHRADLLNLLLDEARRLGVELRTDCAVVSIDLPSSTARTVNSDVFTGDMLVCADGERSTIRAALLIQKNPQHINPPPRFSGKLVYRVTIPSASMLADPLTRDLIDPPNVTCWLGPRAHVVCYDLAHRGTCNVVLIKTADGRDNLGKGRIGGPRVDRIQDLRVIFEGWDERLRRVLEMAQGTVFWPLLEGGEEGEWVFGGGEGEVRCVVIGDAVHHMSPHLVQGASQAIEDAACLGALLSNLTQTSQIADALAIFQEMRQDRVAKITQRADEVGRAWELEDGPQQKARDRRLKEDEPDEGFPNPFADLQLMRWLYEYDLFADVEERWERYVRGTEAEKKMSDG